MKKLTLIRHAQAANPSLNQTDFDRCLTKHGQHQAEQTGKRLAQHNFCFEHMFTSTAVRASSTAHTILDQLYEKSPITEDDQLYNITSDQLYRFIEMIDDDITHAIIVAHNPGLSHLLNDLLVNPTPGMSPCTVVQLQLNIKDWVEVHSRCAQLLSYDPAD